MKTGGPFSVMERESVAFTCPPGSKSENVEINRTADTGNTTYTGTQANHAPNGSPHSETERQNDHGRELTE